MTRDPLNNLEHIIVRPLSDEEHARVWGAIERSLPKTPTLSPFSFFRHKLVAFAAVFVVLISIGGISDPARPGDMLFAIDLAFEQAETAVDPGSRADHAHERLREFQASFGVPTETAPTERMGKAVAQQAETATFMMAMDASESAGTPDLPEGTRQAIERTRRELDTLYAQAALTGDDKTLAKIQAIIDEFESYITSL
jgi:hypothetical protein